MSSSDKVKKIICDATKKHPKFCYKCNNNVIVLQCQHKMCNECCTGINCITHRRNLLLTIDNKLNAYSKNPNKYNYKCSACKNDCADYGYMICNNCCVILCTNCAEYVEGICSKKGCSQCLHVSYSANKNATYCRKCYSKYPNRCLKCHSICHDRKKCDKCEMFFCGKCVPIEEYIPKCPKRNCYYCKNNTCERSKNKVLCKNCIPVTFEDGYEYSSDEYSDFDLKSDTDFDLKSDTGSDTNIDTNTTEENKNYPKHNNYCSLCKKNPYSSLCENTRCLTCCFEHESPCSYHLIEKEKRVRRKKGIIERKVMEKEKRIEKEIKMVEKNDKRKQIKYCSSEKLMIEYQNIMNRKQNLPSDAVELIMRFVDDRPTCVSCKEKYEKGLKFECKICSEDLCKKCLKMRLRLCKNHECYDCRKRPINEYDLELLLQNGRNRNSNVLRGNLLCNTNICKKSTCELFCSECFENRTSCSECYLVVDGIALKGDKCSLCNIIYCHSCNVLNKMYTICPNNNCKYCKKNNCKNVKFIDYVCVYCEKGLPLPKQKQKCPEKRSKKHEQKILDRRIRNLQNEERKRIEEEQLIIEEQILKDISSGEYYDNDYERTVNICSECRFREYSDKCSERKCGFCCANISCKKHKNALEKKSVIPKEPKKQKKQKTKESQNTKKHMDKSLIRNDVIPLCKKCKINPRISKCSQKRCCVCCDNTNCENMEHKKNNRQKPEYIPDLKLTYDHEIIKKLLIDLTPLPECIIPILIKCIDTRKKCRFCRRRCDPGEYFMCEEDEKCSGIFCGACIKRTVITCTSTMCTDTHCDSFDVIGYCQRHYEKNSEKCFGCNAYIDNITRVGFSCRNCNKLYCHVCDKMEMKLMIKNCNDKKCNKCKYNVPYYESTTEEILCRDCVVSSEEDDENDNNEDDDDGDDDDNDNDNDDDMDK